MSGWPTRLLARFDVDARQLRSLVVAGLKLDFRSPGAQPDAGQKQRIIGQLAMYLMMGLLLGVFAVSVPDVFLSGSVGISALMFFIAAAVLVEFAVVVISPLDYDVLGFQPISSATYFVARLANVLFYTTAITTALGLLPMAAYFFARGFNPVLGIVAIGAFYLASTATTLAVIVAYVGAARLVHPSRLKRVFTYVQLAVSFAVYGAYFVLPTVFHLDAIRTWTVEKSPWMLLYPPTWFASFLDLAVGRWSALEIVPAGAAIASVVLLVWLAGSRLTLGYSEMLSRQVSSSDGARVPVRRLPNLLGTRGERRAVALLLAAQFRHDQRFRLMVLSILPLTLLYLVMGVREGGLNDPFVAARGAGQSFLLYFAMIMFPAMLIAGISRSDAYRASWVFYVTPARRPELVLAVKNVALTWFVLPYMLFLAVLLAWFFGSALHAFLHMAVEGLIVNVALLAIVALQPQIPFSQPVQKGQTTASLMIVMFGGGILQAGSTTVLAYAVYPYPFLLVAVVATLLALGLLGQWWLRRRLQKVTANLEFVG